MFNRFGTTSDMVIQTVEDQGQTLQLAIDARGLYFTTQNRVDSGLADTNRFASNREATLSRLAALGLNPSELFTANQHRIPAATSAPSQKVNPIKASKRQMKG